MAVHPWKKPNRPTRYMQRMASIHVRVDWRESAEITRLANHYEVSVDLLVSALSAVALDSICRDARSAKQLEWLLNSARVIPASFPHSLSSMASDTYG